MAVYFVLDEDGLIKIGTTEFVRKRTRQLDGVLIGVERGGFDRERELHAQFDDLRAEGEWFRPGKTLLAYIAELPEDPSTWLHRVRLPGRQRPSAPSGRPRHGSNSKFRLANKLYGGQLVEHLTERRSAGWSWRRISLDMYASKGVSLSHETLRAWSRGEVAA